MAIDVSALELGRRLTSIRENAGLKQAELARKVTWSPAVLSRIESGERRIDPVEFVKWAKAVKEDPVAAYASLQKLPYIAVVGEREAASGGLNIRSREKGELGDMSIEAFLAQVATERFAPSPTRTAQAAE